MASLPPRLCPPVVTRVMSSKLYNGLLGSLPWSVTHCSRAQQQHGESMSICGKLYGCRKTAKAAISSLQKGAKKVAVTCLQEVGEELHLGRRCDEGIEGRVVL